MTGMYAKGMLLCAIQSIFLLHGVIKAQQPSDVPAGEKQSVQQYNGQTPIWRYPHSPAFFYVAGMTINADGAPNAYDPEDQRGLDFLRCAGHPGHWSALVTDTGKPDGIPVTQRDGRYAGFYISTTSLVDPAKLPSDPAKYVNAAVIPYVVLPPKLAKTMGATLGDLAMVINARTGAASYAIYADNGPAQHLGEGSIALANALGLPTKLRERVAGADADIIYLIFPGTVAKTAWPRTPDEMTAAANMAFTNWGGMARLAAGFPKYPLLPR